MTTPVFDRRALLLGLGLSPALAALSPFHAAWARGEEEGGDRPGARLSPWRPGRLDIHHIATGRGDSTLVVGPDGTTLLFDAGVTADSLDVSAAPRPSNARRPGEWIARYVGRRLVDTGGQGLDYAVISHLHPDHLGDVDEASPPSAHGPYRLTGIMDVAEALPIGLLLDRGYPDYGYPQPQTAPFARNYMAFVEARARAGGRVERFRPGRADQIRLVRRSAAFAGFQVRNLCANGEVWTGQGDRTRQLFPPLQGLSPRDYPDENMCSIALKLSYGRFDYFAAGDETSNTFDGDMPWRDVEGAAARAAGPVEAAAAAHHGLPDATGADVVRALRPEVWVIPTWHVTHPDIVPLERMFSERLYPGPRDVFATAVMRENALINARLLRRARSTSGHVILRVGPDAGDFRVVVTDSGDEGDRVIGAFGPYPCI